MSKLDQMRAMREARYVARTTAATNPPQPAPAQKASSPARLTSVPIRESDEKPSPEQRIAEGVASATDSSPAPIKAGKPIHLYKAAEIEDLVRWITRDGKPRSLDQIIDAGMTELQFVRRGRKIVEAFSTAVETAGIAVVDEPVEKAG